MSKPFPAIPTKLYLPPSALPVTFLIRFSVASQQPSPSSVGILFDPLSSHNSICILREKNRRPCLRSPSSPSLGLMIKSSDSNT